MLNYLKFLLKFANLCYDFKAQQKYLDYGLDNFHVDVSIVPLLESTISIRILETVDEDNDAT